MKPFLPTLPRLCYTSSMTILLSASWLIAVAAGAQQAPVYQSPPGYPPPGAYRVPPPPAYGAPPVVPPQSKVGERVGGFVRRLFYGDPQPQYGQVPAYANQPKGTRRSLDAPPSIRRSAPPSDRSAQVTSAPGKATAPTPPVGETKSSSKVASNGSKKYTPPKIHDGASSGAESVGKSAASKKSEISRSQVALNQTPPSSIPPPPSKPTLSNEPTPPPTLSTALPGSKNGDSEGQTMDSTVSRETEPEKSVNKPTPLGSQQFLVGKNTATPGRVMSPYPPYQELDVTGMASGSLALDPTTNKVFQIP